ncbi:APC family permease [Bengtsoniella intestinalis]|uniref:APC family permease n=1 Tax=Bengtsoniella intestinalis TaxID=3073143 RepID=UPI00391F74C8
MSTKQRASLEKTLSMKDILALAFGTMIGWGWIMLAGSWVSAGGVLGAILAFLIGAILCIFVGLTYAELTPALPLAGGELVFAYRGLGSEASWITGWMITFAYVGVAAWEGPALITAIDYIVYLPRLGYLWTIAGFEVYASWVLIGSLGGLILAVINYIGIKSAAVFQLTATLAMALGGVCFFFSGAVNGDVANMVPTFTSTSGFVTVLLMVPAMFVGFDVIPQAAEEMNIPLTKIAKVLILSICMAAAWYMIMIISIAMSAPASIRETDGIPVAESFAYAMGNEAFGKVMIVAAMCGILTSWNGFIVGATRVMFAMGRAKMLPEIFGKAHPKYKTPVAAIIMVGVITCLSPLLGKNALVWFVNASAFGTVVAYFMVACSFLALRKKEPELARPYKVKHGTAVGILAIGVALFFLYMYLPIGPGALVGAEWAMVLGWAALGVVFYIMSKFSYKDVTKEETEYLMFGDEYKRF